MTTVTSSRGSSVCMSSAFERRIEVGLVVVRSHQQLRLLASAGRQCDFCFSPPESVELRSASCSMPRRCSASTTRVRTCASGGRGSGATALVMTRIAHLRGLEDHRHQASHLRIPACDPRSCPRRDPAGHLAGVALRNDAVKGQRQRGLPLPTATRPTRSPAGPVSAMSLRTSHRSNSAT